MENLLTGALPAEEKPEEPQETPEPEAGEWTQLDFGALMSMLPFVSMEVADQLFRTFCRQKPLEVGQLAALAPFVSPEVLDEYAADCPQEALCVLAPFLSGNAVDRIVQKTMGLQAAPSPRRPEAEKRESPRMRLIRRAFDKADDELIAQLCESAAEWNSHEQLLLCSLLMDHKRYDALIELAEELDEDMQTALLDQAFERNDRELIRLLTEHI